jgi:transcriptional regulator with XRE-family HTH domain
MPRQLTDVQQAVIDLRAKLELSQQGLADELKITQVTVARWETIREPDEFHLWLLSTYAHQKGFGKLSRRFLYPLWFDRPALLKEEWEELERA